jgi:hypothetical protein
LIIHLPLVAFVSPRESFRYSFQQSNIDFMSFKNSPLFLQAVFFVKPPCIELTALTFLLSLILLFL